MLSGLVVRSFSILLFFVVAANFAFAAGESPCSGVRCLGERDSFERLALELSPQVDLFKEIWSQDPSAVLLHGSVRDYLFWVKAQFRDVRSRAEAEKISAELRKRTTISANDFLDKGGAGDLDLATSKDLSLSLKNWGIRRLDMKNGLSKPSAGSDEYKQGWLPLEKLSLSREGFSASLGDGIQEIYDGRISIEMPSLAEFNSTARAKAGSNHRVLLGLRYVRAVVLNRLSDPRAPPSDGKYDQTVRSVITQAARSGELSSMEDPRLWTWMNSSIAKILRKDRDPKVAVQALENYGVRELTHAYAGRLKGLNQIVGIVETPEATIQENMRRFGARAESLYLRGAKAFPGDIVYHGTNGGQAAYRSILLDGPIMGENGVLWVSSELNVDYSRNFGGGEDQLVRFPIDPKTKLIDLTSREGEKLWAASKSVHNGDRMKFMEMFGADGLRLDFGPEQKSSYFRSRGAGTDGHYILRNAAVLGRGTSVSGGIVSLEDARSRVLKASPDEIRKIFSEIREFGFSESETRALVSEMLSSSKMPNLSRAQFGAQLIEQIRGIQELVGAATPPYGEKPDLLGAEIFSRLNLAFRSKTKGGAGLADSLIKNIAALDSVREIEDFFKVVPRFFPRNYEGIWTLEEATEIPRGAAKAWAERRVFPRYIEQTGDFSILLRLSEHSQNGLVSDYVESLRSAIAAVPRMKQRALPIREDDLARISSSQTLSKMPADRLFETVLGLAMRSNTSEETRASIFSIIDNKLTQALKDETDGRGGFRYYQRLGEALRSDVIRLFSTAPEIKKYPDWAAQAALGTSDPAAIRATLELPDGLDALIRTANSHGLDAISVAAHAGVKLNEKQERAFLSSTLDAGTAPHGTYYRFQYQQPWLEALARNPDLAIHPNTEELLLVKFASLYENYRIIPPQSGRGFTYEHLGSELTKLNDFWDALVKIRNPKLLNRIAEQMFFRNKWNRDPAGSESEFLKKFFRRYRAAVAELGLDSTSPEAQRAQFLMSLQERVYKSLDEPLPKDYDVARRTKKARMDAIGSLMDRKLVEYTLTEPDPVKALAYYDLEYLRMKSPSSMRVATRTHPGFLSDMKDSLVEFGEACREAYHRMRR